jgi:hypothetical protein
MRKATYFIMLGFLLVILSCNKEDKIGNYEYKTFYKKVNVGGDFDGIIYTYKIYLNETNDTVFSVPLKAQKFKSQKDSDTVYVKGKIDVKKVKNQLYILTKDYHINGYEKFTGTDSIVRTYLQEENGKVKFYKINYYWKGKEKVFDSSKSVYKISKGELPPAPNN